MKCIKLIILGSTLYFISGVAAKVVHSLPDNSMMDFIVGTTAFFAFFAALFCYVSAFTLHFYSRD